MSDAKLIGKLLRVPRLIWEGRFDTVGRVLAVERLVRLIGVGRVYRTARWIGFRRLASWAMTHRVPKGPPVEAESTEAARKNGAEAARRSKRAA